MPLTLGPPVLPLLADLTPVTVSEIITVPMTIWFFGVMAWVFAASGRRAGVAPIWRWVLAYGILLLSIYFALFAPAADVNNPGLGPYIVDPATRYQYDGRRPVVALFATLIVPLLTIVVLIIADWFEIKKMREILG